MITFCRCDLKLEVGTWMWMMHWLNVKVDDKSAIVKACCRQY